MSKDVPKKGSTKVFSIRITHDLYDRLCALAEKDHRNTNGQIIHYLEKGIAQQKIEEEFLEEREAEIAKALNPGKPLTQKKEKIS